MLFPRRTWATRVIGKMGLPIKSKEATALIELLIWASKEDTKTMNEVAGFSLSTRDLIITWSTRMYRNQSAVTQFAKDASLNEAEALETLKAMRTAGLAMAAELGMQKLLELENNTASCLYMDATLKAPIKINVRIGEDIPRDAYEHHKDANGQLYAVGFVENGEQQISYIEKHLWDDFMKKRGLA